MLAICKEAHEPISYSTPVCPACMIIAHFAEKVRVLNERIEVLEGDIEEFSHEEIKA